MVKAEKEIHMMHPAVHHVACCSKSDRTDALTVTSAWLVQCSPSPQTPFRKPPPPPPPPIHFPPFLIAQGAPSSSLLFHNIYPPLGILVLYNNANLETQTDLGGN